MFIQQGPSRGSGDDFVSSTEQAQPVKLIQSYEDGGFFLKSPFTQNWAVL
jgi:hypothetical protein